MSNESARCQFIDLTSYMECEEWYPYEEGQKFCPRHRSTTQNIQNPTREANISKTTIFNGTYVQDFNADVNECSKMPRPDLVAHIKGIEEQIKTLERKRRAANVALRNLDDRLSEEERQILQENSRSFKVDKKAGRPKKHVLTLEEREAVAKDKKSSFAAWATRLGMKSAKELMLMDDAELEARIAKYKAQKGA